MIITTAKEKRILLNILSGHNGVFIVGCGSCATACQTGGEKEVTDLSEFLMKNGKTIIGSVIPDETCHVLLVKKDLAKHKAAVDQSDCVLVMACGAGVQAVSGLIEDKPVYSALDSLFLGNVRRFGKFSETCSLCGQCSLNDYGGVCPVTRCAKGLLNGPCGGAKDAKCESYPDQDCAWVLIFNRLKKFNKLGNLSDMKMPKDHSVKQKPFNFEIKKESDKP